VRLQGTIPATGSAQEEGIFIRRVLAGEKLLNPCLIMAFKNYCFTNTIYVFQNIKIFVYLLADLVIYRGPLLWTGGGLFTVPLASKYVYRVQGFCQYSQYTTIV
jgi:hypothetical protein